MNTWKGQRQNAVQSESPRFIFLLSTHTHEGLGPGVGASGIVGVESNAAIVRNQTRTVRATTPHRVIIIRGTIPVRIDTHKTRWCKRYGPLYEAKEQKKKKKRLHTHTSIVPERHVGQDCS